MANTNTKAPVEDSNAASDEALDKIFADFEGSQQLIDDNELETIDRMERSLEYSIRPRRASLLVLTKSGKELIEMAENHDGAVALAGIKMAAESYRDRLKEMADLLDASIARSSVALCYCADIDGAKLDAKALYEEEVAA